MNTTYIKKNNRSSLDAEVRRKDFLVVRLLGLWFVFQLFFNDMTNVWTIESFVNIRPDRILFITIVIVFLIRRDSSARKKSIHPVEISMVIFFCLVSVSCILYGAIEDPGNKYISTVFNFIGIPMVTFFITRRMGFDRDKVGKIFTVFFAIGLYLGATGICEHYGISALIYPKYIMDRTLGLHFDRVRGPFLQAAVMGAVLSVMFMIIAFDASLKKQRVLHYIALAIVMASVYFTYTRSGWVHLAISIAVGGILCRRWRGAMMTFGLCILAVYLFGILGKFSYEDGTLFTRRSGPVDDRWNIMAASVRMFTDKPIFGFGYGNFEKFNDPYFERMEGIELSGEGEGNHNTVLGLLAEVGLLGTTPYLLIFWFFAKEGIGLINRLESEGNLYDGTLGAIFLGILAGYFAHAQLIDFRFFNFLNSLVFGISGLVFSYCEDSRSEAREKIRPNSVPL